MWSFAKRRGLQDKGPAADGESGRAEAAQEIKEPSTREKVSGFLLQIKIIVLDLQWFIVGHCPALGPAEADFYLKSASSILKPGRVISSRV